MLNNALGTLASSFVSTPLVPPVSGYKLWLDAADTSTLTLNGSGVSQWTDKSANAYIFTQATAVNQAQSGIATINGKNVLVFDGINDSIQSTAAASTWSFMHNATGYTAFMAFKYQTPTLFNPYWDTDGAYSGYIGSAFSDSSGLATGSVSRGVTPASNRVSSGDAASTFTNNSNYYVSIVYNNTTATAADRIKIKINGGTESKTNTLTNAYSTSNPQYSLLLCADGGGYFAKTYIAEIIFYTGQLSSTDVNSVNSYLSTKWGI